MTFKRPKYSFWCIIIQEPHFTKNDFCKECGADKIKDQKENTITLYPAFPTTSILYINALFLSQIRKQFNQIPANIKIYDLRNSGLSEEEKSSKISGKTANDMRMNRFFKNENGKKYKCGDMLNYIFEN